MIEESAVTGIDIIMTLLGFGFGWIVINWLDRNVFNKGRYKRSNEND